MSASTAETAAFVDAFRQGLRELGYVQEKNIVLEIRGGEAKPDRLSKLAAELAVLKLTSSSPERALQSMLLRQRPVRFPLSCGTVPIP